MLDTYEGSTKHEKTKDNDPSGPSRNNADDAQQTRGPGRPLSTRIPYQDEAGKGKRCRIVRSHGHETLPRFVGKWFNRNDNECEKDLYRANILMLLKPWRNLHELKILMETFEETYDQFILQADPKTLRVIANIQYFYECSDGAKAEREKARESYQLNHAEPENNDISNLDMDIDDAREIEEIQGTIILEEITDDDIERARLMKTHARERLYGESAVSLGYDAGFFKETHENFTYAFKARKMQTDEGENIRTWEAQLKATTREQINQFGTVNITAESDEARISITHHDNLTRTVPEAQPRIDNQSLTRQIRVGQTYIGRVELSKLNEEQRRAHDIIEERLIEHITSES